MTETQREELKALASYEEDLLREYAVRAVSKAVRTGDEEVLRTIGDFLRHARAALRRQEEAAQDEDDAASADSLLSQA